MDRRIALIEDDEIISENYADFLRGLGFDVQAYLTKDAALEGLSRRLPDLVLLDITMNGERDAGFAICAAIRRRDELLPVIFLTSHDSEVEKISGLRLGADDYITKDVSFDYLVIRIEALFRRLEAYAAARRTADTGSSRAAEKAPGEPAFDVAASVVAWQSRPLDLTLTQFWMLQALCRSPGETRSHAELMKAAGLTVEHNTVTAHVRAIRHAFQEIDPTFDRIRTERGRGYRWLPR